ncbi:sulfite reductase (NADPH) flavoprotein alpha-component [Cupriavidus gilardii J11]|uniref:NADPH--hemoprotein reductase n=1 Tax=Cupriavidus gilardii J11 TaxID=936133 RepID=A0A562BQI9_9BURK|nr:sulfite reductase flavoprotein subunit alpha [Cupriavidus gilardii]TWG87431.1 sulfite reductase (NADPH) flavoprotein alpha-component [Cupriavidus gilardii J11]
MVLAGAWLLAAAGGALAWAAPDKWASAAGVAAAYAGFCAAIVLRHRWRRAGTGSEAGAQADEDVTLVAYASQTGFGEQLATQTATALRQAGLPARMLSFADLDAALLTRCRQALFIVSTTGEGDAPDSAAGFTRKLSRAAQSGSLRSLRYGLLALGDSSYARFCAYGRGLSEWLQRHHAQPLFDPVEVDNGDPGALRHWQNHLSALAGGAEIADWDAPRYGRWRLRQRVLLNAGSAGAPAFHLTLVPAGDEAPAWQAGDIAEVGARHADDEVRDWLSELGHDGAATVRCDGMDMTLAEALSTRLRLPRSATAALRELDAQGLIDALPPLPHREYSIASLPADGGIELLVRQARRPDGSLGLASGWLTAHAPLDGDIALRIRGNRAFRPPDDDRPLILIGNGTGMAGLRALLKARAARGHGRNWLLFGERSAAHDAFFAGELGAWRQRGLLARADLVWSRDGGRLRYVQDAVRAAADELRTWVGEGASIYVCGSLQGMATGVHAALVEVLGEEAVLALTEEGRYRRDVY